MIGLFKKLFIYGYHDLLVAMRTDDDEKLSRGIGVTT